MIPISQAGFRKGKSTLNNIFVLNHIIQREGENKKKSQKVYALFIDLKTAFDKVDRKKLWTIMEKKEINKNLKGRIKGIYKETKGMIRTMEELTKKFGIKKGLRQGCVMSPCLFNLYIADLDAELVKRGIGGIAVGKERVWSLAYADDMVLVAKNREVLLDMMDTLKSIF